MQPRGSNTENSNANDGNNNNDNTVVNSTSDEKASSGSTKASGATPPQANTPPATRSVRTTQLTAPQQAPVVPLSQAASPLISAVNPVTNTNTIKPSPSIGVHQPQPFHPAPPSASAFVPILSSNYSPQQAATSGPSHNLINSNFLQPPVSFYQQQLVPQQLPPTQDWANIEIERLRMELNKLFGEKQSLLNSNTTLNQNLHAQQEHINLLQSLLEAEKTKTSGLLDQLTSAYDFVNKFSQGYNASFKPQLVHRLSGNTQTSHTSHTSQSHTPLLPEQPPFGTPTSHQSPYLQHSQSEIISSHQHSQRANQRQPVGISTPLTYSPQQQYSHSRNHRSLFYSSETQQQPNQTAQSIFLTPTQNNSPPTHNRPLNHWQHPLPESTLHPRQQQQLNTAEEAAELQRRYDEKLHSDTQKLLARQQQRRDEARQGEQGATGQDRHVRQKR